MQIRAIWGHSMTVRLRTAVSQAAFLAVIGVVCAGAVNTYRHEGIPWVDSWPSLGITSGAKSAIQNVSVDTAWRRYQEGKVLFVDARTPSEFQPAHIPGALNVPADKVEKSLDALKRVAGSGRKLVIYCSGPGCHLSSELAYILRDKGISKVVVMPEGWTGWLNAGLPIEENGGN